MFFLAVALTSSALIVERTEGLLDRSWVAGVSPGEILFSHVVTQFVVMCGQTALVLVFMILVFGVKCNGNVIFVVMLTLMQGNFFFSELSIADRTKSHRKFNLNATT